MKNLLSEGIIIDCRVGKTDEHNDQKHPQACLFVEFPCEYETMLKQVLGEELRFYPDINNLNIKLKAHPRGYILAPRLIADRLVLFTTIAGPSWPDIGLITPGFTLSPSRAQVRAGEIYMVLPGPSFRKPPHRQHRGAMTEHHRAAPTKGCRADPSLYEQVQAMLGKAQE